ncbi:PQQ-binding-like beta-propeller repeat protein [Flavobacterium sp. 5]|uniref:outer membrane protein assembly factor BamB family protein n=1 Tax=Flavobacterium sp. 5 TaxID=2035199 RepID=UPI000C2CA695|nr:PQQ-binding-like beta-propeller repeat protein [Flavobacterium sp. 5]PKB16220.1 outer membrane protein assembly factor BamB [Flavobacterium sp. 5]
MNRWYLVCVLLVFLVVNNSDVFGQQDKTMAISPFQNHVFKGGKYNPLGNLKWAFKTKGKIFSSPIVDRGIVYIGSEDGYLYAIEEKTGKLHWKFQTGGAVHSSPAIFKNMVYIGSFDGYYYAIDTKTGNLKWKFKTGGEQWSGEKSFLGMKPVDMYMEDLWDFFLSTPVINSEGKEPRIFFGSSDGNVYALNANTGELRWKFKTNGSIHCSPVLNKKTLYIGSWDANLYAIDIETGKERWKFETGTQTGFKGIESSVAVADGMVYFGARDPFLFAVNAETGKLFWKYDAAYSWILSSAVVVDGVVYVGTSDTFLLLGLDAKSGKEVFKFKANGYIYSSPAIMGETAYFGDFTGDFFAVHIKDSNKESSVFSTEGRKEFAPDILNNNLIDFSYAAKGADLSMYDVNKTIMDQFYKLGSIVSSPFIANNTVYFGSADGNCYAIELKE